MNDIRSSLRQLTFPKEFRIGASVQPPELLVALNRLAAVLAERTTTPSSSPALSDRALSDVGTGLWRLRQKMRQPGSDRPLEEMRGAYRHFESVWDVLTEAGLGIRDHTDELVPDGGVFGLKIIAFQPVPGLVRKRVIETVSPSVYFAGRLLKMGEVIVGVPEKNEPEPADADSASSGPTTPGAEADCVQRMTLEE